MCWIWFMLPWAIAPLQHESTTTAVRNHPQHWLILPSGSFARCLIICLRIVLITRFTSGYTRSLMARRRVLQRKRQSRSATAKSCIKNQERTQKGRTSGTTTVHLIFLLATGAVKMNNLATSLPTTPGNPSR
jgi:hypothetical protein